MSYRHFEWDDRKAESNRRKHRVTFDDATHVFDDPHRLMRLDRIENGEERWQTIGESYGSTLLLVAHTVWDDEAGIEIIRIISARLATRNERKQYHEYRAKDFG